MYPTLTQIIIIFERGVFPKVSIFNNETKFVWHCKNFIPGIATIIGTMHVSLTYFQIKF